MIVLDHPPLWVPPKPAIIRRAPDLIKPPHVLAGVLPQIGAWGWNAGDVASPVYVGGNKGGSIGSGSITLSLTALTGGIATAVAEGDLVIAVHGIGSTIDESVLIYDPAINQYTLIGTELTRADTFDANMRVAYKFMGATPDASTLSSTTNSANSHCMIVHVWRGVNATLLDVAATTATGIDSPLADPPSITPITPGAIILACGMAAHNQGAAVFTHGALSNLVTQGQNSTNDCTIGVGSFAWTGGAYDPAAFGFSATPATTHSWVALTLALRPA